MWTHYILEKRYNIRACNQQGARRFDDAIVLSPFEIFRSQCVVFRPEKVGPTEAQSAAPFHET
jgi:hypothetical protein